MKAVAINGSPRRGGNTEIMLRKVLEPLEAKDSHQHPDRYHQRKQLCQTVADSNG